MNKTLFPDRVKKLLEKRSGLCVGLDPSTELLQSWELTDDIKSLRQFTAVMVAACIKSQVGFVKPQIAFYERFGWQGLQILSEMSMQLREAGILVILDAKRGDIGSTASAYASAYLSENDYHKYDAITVNPFLGFKTLEPFINIIKNESVGIFVIVRSSNPDSDLIQEAHTKEGLSVAESLAQKIKEENKNIFGESKLGAIGAVIGSTVNNIDFLLKQMSTSFFLCPGIGAQGATFQSATENLGPFSSQCIFPISRGLTLGVRTEDELIKKINELKTQLFNSMSKTQKV